MYDDNEESLLNHYGKCETFIDAAMETRGTVLVHWLVHYIASCHTIMLAETYVRVRGWVCGCGYFTDFVLLTVL